MVIVVPPPVDDQAHEAYERTKNRPVLRTAKTSKQYSDGARQIAQKLGLKWVDLYNLLAENRKDGSLAHLLPDGLHLNAIAYKIFYEEV